MKQIWDRLVFFICSHTCKLPDQILVKNFNRLRIEIIIWNSLRGDYETELLAEFVRQVIVDCFCHQGFQSHEKPLERAEYPGF